jgi:serine/threonine protein kinase
MKIYNSTYGQVFKAKYKVNGKFVAIKKFKESDQEDEHVSIKIVTA